MKYVLNDGYPCEQKEELKGYLNLKDIQEEKETSYVKGIENCYNIAKFVAQWAEDT